MKKHQPIEIVDARSRMERYVSRLYEKIATPNHMTNEMGDIETSNYIYSIYISRIMPSLTLRIRKAHNRFNAIELTFMSTKKNNWKVTIASSNKDNIWEGQYVSAIDDDDIQYRIYSMIIDHLFAVINALDSTGIGDNCELLKILDDFSIKK